MLLGLLYDSSSSDLNLIVPHDKFCTMDVFLQKLAGYVTAEKQMESHSSVAPSVSRFIRYRKSHLSVSLTQAGVIGLMRVIACSDATADMTFTTSRRGCDFVLSLQNAFKCALSVLQQYPATPTIHHRLNVPNTPSPSSSNPPSPNRIQTRPLRPSATRSNSRHPAPP
ncbi:hypothetical protein M405DRAFT_205338 [Rhizopogon salebrosus TDB-379]|nr:hypothetical protein M405DRAFT_205338 [Rhizopogon salebrosus TDB-379]